MLAENVATMNSGDDRESEVIDPDYDDETVDPTEYGITSFGIDYDVDGIVRRLKNGDIEIPDFQRGFVWDIKRSSRFIESLLRRLPVPGIFLYREPDSQRQKVIDGQQRLETLRRYLNGKFNGREFALTGVCEPFEGHTFNGLAEREKRILRDSIIHATVIRQDRPDDGGSSQYAIFERLNTNATPLSPQEIRSAIYGGEFNQLLKVLNKNDDWRVLFGRPHKRMRDQEMILRFLALYFDSRRYQEPMKGFLNQFMNANRDLGKIGESEIRGAFEKTAATIHDKLGHRAFRPVRALNATVLDSLMIGIARRICEKGPIDSDINAQYRELLDNPRFREATEARTSKPENVRRRLDLATKAFADVV